MSRAEKNCMKLTETKLEGVYLIELTPHADERGFYKRLWGKDELESLHLNSELNNVGLSYNKKRGTVRGMHYQAEPFAEIKLVQCTRGKIFDVVLDLRKDSETFGEWTSAELSTENNKAFYIPKGLAHGFQTLDDNSEVLYTISATYDLNSSRGVCWNDPQFAIKFPLEISCINERDASYPDFEV